VELLDAQVIYHPAQVLPGDARLTDDDRMSYAVEMARASLDAVGVDAALWHGELPLCEIAVERYPDRFAGVVTYTYEDPIPDAREAVGHIEAHPGLVGIRLNPAWPASGENMLRLREGAYDQIFALAEEHEIPISLFMSGHVSETHDVAQRYERLGLIIDHLGVLPAPNVPLVPERFDALPELLELAKYPNVAVKMTGTASMSLDPFPFADLWPHLHRVLDAFGLERVMWGSDFMRVSALNTYADAVRFITDTTELTPSEKEQLLSKSARHWFKWRPTTRT